MKTFQVPVFLGVYAESAEQAQELALSFMEYAVDISDDPDTYVYCDVGNLNEIVVQLT